ncbi:hypothetical protein [Polaribacter sp. Asnod6-C07]|uniref:hypothetical protein n=1 Tax=Polaribacter sp. Asnod6-C07 TaxID=3160582 RepID=UPI0038706D39
MKKIISALIIILFLACSNDDNDSNCESCKTYSSSGIFLFRTICNNGDGTVTVSNSASSTSTGSIGITARIPEGKTFEEYVNESCNN